MPIEKSENEASPLSAEQIEQLTYIEGKLGLPVGFCQSLRNTGTDWEFSIKSVVILVAALATVIASHLNNDAVLAHIEKLNLDGGRTGKLELAESLGVLTRIERKAFATIADIRNRFAHKVVNIASDLPTYARSIKVEDLEAIQKRLLMIPPESEKEAEHLWRGEQVARFLRITLFISASWLLNTLAHQDQHAQVEAERRKWLEKNFGGNGTLAGLFHWEQANPGKSPLGGDIKSI